jgi:hypothetical protein
VQRELTFAIKKLSLRLKNFILEFAKPAFAVKKFSLYSKNYALELENSLFAIKKLLLTIKNLPTACRKLSFYFGAHPIDVKE